MDKEKAVHAHSEAAFILQSNQQGSMGNLSCPPPKRRGSQNVLGKARLKCRNKTKIYLQSRSDLSST